MSEMNPIVKNLERSTRGRAIKAMCAHCMGCTAESLEPGFRTLIRDCASTHCPMGAKTIWRRRKCDKCKHIFHTYEERA